MPATRFNPAPGWPPAPEGWLPAEDWYPPEDWPEAPAGWSFIVPVEPNAKPVTTALLDTVRTARGQSTITSNAEVVTPVGKAANEVLWEGASSKITGIGGGRYRLTRHHLYFESGILRTDSQQIPVEHISDIDVSQTMLQKGRGVSNVHVYLHRPSGVDEFVIMEDLTDGKGVQGVLNEAVRTRKLEVMRESTTHTYLGGQPPHLPSLSGPQAVAEKQPDIIEQIGRLGELLQSGVLTQDEFDAKKADLLSRL